MEQAIYWLVGGVGAPLIQWLKNSFKLEGKPAMWLTIGVSVILAAAALVVSKELDFTALTPENALAAVGQVLAAATLAYKLLKKE